jgi:REP element-mobilizing transposase RayT
MRSRSKCKPRRGTQQELFRRGGKRRGAGRKPKGARAGERHEARLAFKAYHALHVVMRVAPEVGSLRRRAMYKALREATITAALREWFRIVHISLQRTHVHLIVEADDKAALGRGMQGFAISAARNINTALGDGVRRRRGRVFADRYHVEVITTPTRARHAISYVLSNWRKRATRHCWPIRKGGCGPTEIWKSRPAGGIPVRSKLARQTGSEPCDEHEEESAEAGRQRVRRCVGTRGYGPREVSPEISSMFQGSRVCLHMKAAAACLRSWRRKHAALGGVLVRGMYNKDGPVTWDTRALGGDTGGRRQGRPKSGAGMRRGSRRAR